MEPASATFQHPDTMHGARADRWAWSGALVGLSFIAGLGSAMAAADVPYPRPWAEGTQVRRYFTTNRRPARLSVAGQLVSAASLAVFTRTVRQLAQRTGPGWYRRRSLATVSGAAASATLAAAAACSLAQTTGAVRDADTAARVNRVGFAVGGPVHTAAFGVFTGVLSSAGRRTGELSSALTTAAAVGAAAGALSPTYFLTRAAGWFIPVARFLGLAAAGMAGAQLARPGRPRPRASEAG